MVYKQESKGPVVGYDKCIVGYDKCIVGYDKCIIVNDIATRDWELRRIVDNYGPFDSLYDKRRFTYSPVAHFEGSFKMAGHPNFDIHDKINLVIDYFGEPQVFKNVYITEMTLDQYFTTVKFYAEGLENYIEYEKVFEIIDSQPIQIEGSNYAKGSRL